MAGTRGRGFATNFPVAGGVLSAAPGRAFVYLVVVALSLCHGAFGYSHQLSPAHVQAAHVAHSAEGAHSLPDRTSAESHAGVAYFATLLALFFGTHLLPGGRVWAATELPAPVAQKRLRRAGVFRPPRGPTLPSLQVFRL